MSNSINGLSPTQISDDSQDVNSIYGLSPTQVGGDSQHAISTLCLSTRVGSNVMASLTTMDSNELEIHHSDPLRLGELRNRKDILGSTAGSGSLSDGGKSQSNEDSMEDEYITELEDMPDNDILPPEFFTPDHDAKLVDYVDSVEAVEPSFSLYFVGQAITEVEQEGWSSSGLLASVH